MRTACHHHHHHDDTKNKETSKGATCTLSSFYFTATGIGLVLILLLDEKIVIRQSSVKNSRSNIDIGARSTKNELLPPNQAQML